MGLFDFIFGRNKKESDSTARPKLHEEKKTESGIKKRESKSPERPNVKLGSATSRSLNKAEELIAQRITSLVNKCLELEVKGQIKPLQDCLFQLYGYFNKPNGGQHILKFTDKANLALCFAFMLRYDWMHDCDIREVWAEDGFYCIIEHLAHQPDGMQGQAEAMIILFSLLCVGREDLKPKVQDILNKAQLLGNPIFHADDYRIGAQNIIGQVSLLAVSGIRELGPAGAQIMQKICMKFNGLNFFAQTIQRKDLMKYSPTDVFAKAQFIHSVIGSILEDM